MAKEIKWAIALFLGVFLGIFTLWVWVYSPSRQYVEVRAEQIAKRLSPTRNGDRFYILYDTKYGPMENQVSYAKYVTSSNGRIVTFNLSLADYDMMLDNPQAMQSEYPTIKYVNWFYFGRCASIFIWVLIVVPGMVSWVEYKGSGKEYDYGGKYLLVISSGMLFGFILYLIA